MALYRSKSVLALFFLALGLFMGGCKTGPAHGDEIQSIVADIAGKNTDIVRLTVHMPHGDDLVAVASTSAEKRDKPSDPEDLRAIETGETVVLAEGENTDVTVPIRQRDGAFTAAVGVTLSGSDQAAATAKAKDIAASIDSLLTMNGY